MKYLQYGTSICMFVVLLHCPIQTSGVQAQGLRQECTCWQKLADRIGKQLETETDDRPLDSLWLNGALYDLLALEDRDSLSSPVSQPAVELQRVGHSALGKLLLRRSASRKQFREPSGVHCSVCWAILQELSSSAKMSRPAESYDFSFGGISKKAMLNNGW